MAASPLTVSHDIDPCMLISPLYNDLSICKIGYYLALECGRVRIQAHATASTVLISKGLTPVYHTQLIHSSSFIFATSTDFEFKLLASPVLSPQDEAGGRSPVGDSQTCKSLSLLLCSWLFS